MMAFEIKRPPTGSATFTTSDRNERAARKRSTRLTEFEAEDLRYLWAGFSVDIGMRSSHGALEARLLLAPPRENVAAPVLEELMRLGGRASEGRIIRIGMYEGWGTRSEIERAIKRLVREGRLERTAAPAPEVAAPAERNPSEELRLADWSDSAAGQPGFDLQLAHRMRLALPIPSSRADRWRRQDEALERECQMMHGNETLSTRASYDPPENVQTSRVNRARRTLAKLSTRDASIIKVLYCEYYPTEQDELDAVRAFVGGDDEAAREAMDRACAAYREARST